jgi:hypothetical protein
MVPASSLAIRDWLTPAALASSLCFRPSWRRSNIIFGINQGFSATTPLNRKSQVLAKVLLAIMML